MGLQGLGCGEHGGWGPLVQGGSGPTWGHSEVRRGCTVVSWCCPAGCPACLPLPHRLMAKQGVFVAPRGSDTSPSSSCCLPRA